MAANKQTRIKTLILPFQALNDEQMRQAFAVSSENPFWKAILQKIESMRQDSAHQAAGCVAVGKTIEMAGACGAFEILTSLLMELETERQASVKEN